ncbi:MAG TPA: hypothetical protein VIH69_01870, partial [Dehalococcoidia bacterium]
MAKFVCYDSNGVEVTCTDDNWDNHIVAEHPEIKGCEVHVKTTIEKPHRIYQDPRHPNTKILYKPFILPKPFHTQWLRVAIEYRKPRFGNLRGYTLTAFACTGVRKGDILIWEEGQDEKHK